MESFEVVVEGELFRITERMQPEGTVSYDLTWVNGPAEGTYGFTIGHILGWTDGTADDAEAGPASRMARDALIAAARGFVQSFYEPGGIGESDFPDHTPANAGPAE